MRAPLCDVTVAVTAPEEQRVQRLMARDGISEDYARSRMAAQKPQEQPEPMPRTVEPEPEKLYSLRLEFSLTRAQALALRNFLDNENITYKKF